MSDSIYSQRYRVGWNDTLYGLLNWTGSVHLSDPLAWGKHMRILAVEMRDKEGIHYRCGYFDGVIACVDEFEKNGNVERK